MSGIDWWHLNWSWLFWTVVLVVLLRLVVRWIRISAVSHKSSRDLARRVLRLRYLSGEIDQEEYELRLSALQKLQGKT